MFRPEWKPRSEEPQAVLVLPPATFMRNDPGYKLPPHRVCMGVHASVCTCMCVVYVLVSFYNMLPVMTANVILPPIAFDVMF